MSSEKDVEKAQSEAAESFQKEQEEAAKGLKEFIEAQRPPDPEAARILEENWDNLI